MKQSDRILTGELLNKKLKSLTEVGGDADWNIFYLDLDGTKWRKSYPNSGYHVGGAPELTQIDYLPWEKPDTE